MYKQFRRQHTPFPELVSSGWTVSRSSRPLEGHTDFANKRMVVPMDDDPASDVIRVHEFMHAQMSPPDIHAFMQAHDLTDVANVQAAEDCRINETLRQLNNRRTHALLDTRVVSRDPATFQGFIQASARLQPQEQLMFWGRMLASTIGTADYRTIMDAVRHLPYAAVKYPLLDFDNALDSALGDLDDQPTTDFTVKVAQLLDALPEKAADEGPYVFKPVPSNRVPTGDDNQWAEMLIERPRLHAQPKALLRKSTRRMTDEGVKLKSLHRLCTDRRVFTVKKPRVGGSVLIDCSGSMSLSHQEIAMLIEQAPAATVAIYEGNPSTGMGYLRIVGKDGHMVDPEAIYSDNDDLTGGGNMVDGPALKWLGMQDEPRIWLCDGHVTGLGDCSAPNLEREAKALKRRYNIERVPDVETALARFAQVRKKAR